MQESARCGDEGCRILPSLMCMDMCNLERDVRRVMALGANTIHVDIIDGNYSPDMPIGLAAVRQLARKVGVGLDVHLMVRNNAFFVDETIDIGAQSICFQYDGDRDVCVLLDKIRAAGIRAGLALGPGVPVGQLEYLVEECDHLLVMCINPGYAHMGGEGKRPYIERKLADLQALVQKCSPATRVAVDGRIGFDDVRRYQSFGVRDFVAGTSSLYSTEGTLEGNWQRLQELLRAGGTAEAGR